MKKKKECSDSFEMILDNYYAFTKALHHGYDTDQRLSRVQLSWIQIQSAGVVEYTGCISADE